MPGDGWCAMCLPRAAEPPPARMVPWMCASCVYEHPVRSVPRINTLCRGVTISGVSHAVLCGETENQHGRPTLACSDSVA